MIGDDERDLAVELAGPGAPQQVLQAVVVLRDEDRHTLRAHGILESRMHLEALAHLADGSLQRLPVGMELAEVESDALEELPGLGIGVLVGVEDVRPVAVERLRQRGDDATAIGARDEQRPDRFARNLRHEAMVARNSAGKSPTLGNTARLG